MNIKKSILIVIMAFVAFNMSAFAADKASANKPKISVNLQQEIKDVFDRVSKKLPGTVITSISKAPKMDGLYEVVMGRNVAYVDSKVEAFLFGHVFDIETQRDLTQETLDKSNKIDFSKLPLDKAIKFTKGDGSRVFAIFSDMDCPYCQKFEKTLEGVTNYTMYVFMMPIAQLHPQAKAKTDLIWCAKDKAAAWKQYMAKNTLPDAKMQAACDTPTEEIIKLGTSMGVNGTPTLIRQDGRIQPGAPQEVGLLEMFLSAPDAKGGAGSTVSVKQ